MCVWDPKKAESNRKKHGVDFADAVAVLEDERGLTFDDPDEEEDRYITIGMDAFGSVLVVVYTYQDERTRLISARKATKRERRQYEGT